MNIAVLGMGRMGRALAGRLLEGGHRVTVWNRSTGKAGEIVSAGARQAPSVTDAVDGVDVVVTMLADDAAIRAVAFGELRSSIGAQTIYVDCSTVSRRLSGELAEVFSPRFLAMPVVGSPAAVSAGQATFLVGGDTGIADRMGTVISSLTDSVRRYGTAALPVTDLTQAHVRITWSPHRRHPDCVRRRVAHRVRPTAAPAAACPGAPGSRVSYRSRRPRCRCGCNRCCRGGSLPASATRLAAPTGTAVSA